MACRKTMSEAESRVLLANVSAARAEQHHAECLQDSYGCPNARRPSQTSVGRSMAGGESRETFTQILHVKT